MSDFQYRIILPEAKNIMVAQVGERVEGYKLKDIMLEYETIEGEELARSVREGFNIGRQLWYDYTSLYETLDWSKTSTSENLTINIPRKSLKAIVLLCTRKNPSDSEEFYNAEVEKVQVTIEGV